jgi:4-diphosphocytidyl-2-C-methyl-D-erythritol kinase
MLRAELAPAKVNLFLHVGPLDPRDGKHPVSSLMVFADIGDVLAIEPSDHPEFDVAGPLAGPLEDLPASDNLVMRAVALLRGAVRRPMPPFRLVLEKNLPTAAGLGGGSSDAGAALRLVRQAVGLDVSDETLEALASSLGADGAACLFARPCLATGRGDILQPAPGLPVLDAVLVNPMKPCATGAVYRAFDAMVSNPDAEPPPLPPSFESAEEAAAFFSFTRNDLEGPARSLCPEIGEVLETLQAEPETLMARLSGSGATCFALTAGDYEARSLAERLSLLRPDWWIRPCRLGGPWSLR